MKRFLRILVEVTHDALYTAGEIICNNMLNFANILNMLLPFAMYFMGRDKVPVSIGIIIPTVSIILIYYAKNIANKIGKGITVPIPEKRFTEIGDEGEVSIENDRIQEMLLYVADLEDWLQKRGLLK